MGWLVRRMFGDRLVVQVNRSYGGYNQQRCMVTMVDGSVVHVGHWAVEVGYEEGMPHDKCHLCCLTEGRGEDTVEVEESLVAQIHCAWAVSQASWQKKAMEKERPDRGPLVMPPRSVERSCCCDRG